VRQDHGDPGCPLEFEPHLRGHDLSGWSASAALDAAEQSRSSSSSVASGGHSGNGPDHARPMRSNEPRLRLVMDDGPGALRPIRKERRQPSMESLQRLTQGAARTAGTHFGVRSTFRKYLRLIDFCITQL